MKPETEAKTHSNSLQVLAAEQQAENEDRVQKERKAKERYESVFQPYDAAWNALDGEQWSRNASRVAAGIERVVATAKALEIWDGHQSLTEWLAWLPESLESQQDAMSKGIALALAGTIETGVCSHDDAEALIVLMGENHPCNQVARLRRAKPVVESKKPKETPAAKVQLANPVCDSLTRCRERLKVAAEKHRALAVMLVHRANFGNEPEPYEPEGKENQAHHRLNLCRGPSCETMQRTHSLYGKMFQGSSDADYSEAVDEYNDAAAELGRLLDELPQAVGQTLWQGWPQGFSKPEPADLWTNAVFELAWQKQTASRLNAERWAWHNNHQLKIADLPRMRTSDSPVIGLFVELIERVGDPPAFWYSWVNNIWHSSINAIDLLIPMLRGPLEEPELKVFTASTDRPKEPSAVGELKSRLFLDALGGTVGQAAADRLARHFGFDSFYGDDLPARILKAMAGLNYKVNEVAEMPIVDIAAVLCATESGDLLEETPSQDPGGGGAEAEVPGGLDSLTPAPKRAWASWRLAEVNHAETLQDRAAYDWLAEQPDETFIGDLVGYVLPAFATWQRYVREARKAVGESKNQSRAGRVGGGSVVKESEI